MVETITFKPRISIYLVISAFVLTAALLPIRFYLHTTHFDVKAYFNIFLPLIFVVPTFMVLQKMKTLTLVGDEWRVRYLFRRKWVDFKSNQVVEAQVEETAGENTGIPFTKWTLTLSCGRKIRFSSVEMQNTELLDQHFKQFQGYTQNIDLLPRF